MILKLLAFVLPLGLDSFAVAAAIGAAGRLRGLARLRLSVLFVVFEAGMPLIGVAAGAPLAHLVGGIADYVAAAAVVAVGLWMLLHNDEGEEENAPRMATARGMALLALGVSISLDELAIGFSLGLVQLPLVPVIIAIAIQAFLAAQIGLQLGSRIGERFREAAERIAGIALIALGCFLVAERLLK